jgi:hypothetical protein
VKWKPALQVVSGVDRKVSAPTFRTFLVFFVATVVVSLKELVVLHLEEVQQHVEQEEGFYVSHVFPVIPFEVIVLSHCRYVRIVISCDNDQNDPHKGKEFVDPARLSEKKGVERISVVL